MSSNEGGKPLGELYSRQYEERPENQSDSSRARHRIYSLFTNSLTDSEKTKLAVLIESELGIEYPFFGGYGSEGYSHREFWLESSIRDFRDGLTISSRMMRSPTSTRSKKWFDDVERILRDEGMAYTMDSEGGLHPFVDSEFQRLKASVLRNLKDANQAVVYDLVLKSVSALDSKQRNLKNAVRDIHEAVETLVKDRSGESRLDGNATRKLGEQMCTGLLGDDRAATYTKLMCKSLEQWGTAIHQYRHGMPAEEPKEVPEFIAVQAVSSGLTWLRWILDSSQPA